MKKLFCLLLLVPFFAIAQKVITHTVGPKESLSSIGRLYNINGRELANYNKIDYDKGLTIGQVLKIPVKPGAATTAPPPVVIKETPPVKAKDVPVTKPVGVAKENGIGKPIYHTVTKKETLYHISTLYNKVPIADIKKWNNLTSDAVSEGAQLIVGYTKETGAAVSPKETVKTAPSKTNDDEAKKAAQQAADKMKEAADAAAAKAKQQDAKKEETKTEDVKPVKTIEQVKTPEIAVKAADFKGGIFKSVFDDQAKGKQLINENGTGGIFKSTSGWEDGKYYCLHNNAAPGTILKITNTANGKVVYAKVLDLITDIKQNNGLILRLSNAAADALGVADNKLDCTINYSK
ncbi:DPBB and LysM peptidoglycan-binding domain-containing protein [Ferruginibacter sp. SUN106]|uniref:DPBB and LysM peptidoglycan-binding domain-containing protein n=1 Tax=Ferruginibacter sp. SUN106 TaxID=2978348 RepID=UPI003D364FA0